MDRFSARENRRRLAELLSCRRRPSRLRVEELEPRIAPSSLLYNLPLLGVLDELRVQSGTGGSEFGFDEPDFSPVSPSEFWQPSFPLRHEEHRESSVAEWVPSSLFRPSGDREPLSPAEDRTPNTEHLLPAFLSDPTELAAGNDILHSLIPIAWDDATAEAADRGWPIADSGHQPLTINHPPSAMAGDSAHRNPAASLESPDTIYVVSDSGSAEVAGKGTRGAAAHARGVQIPDRIPPWVTGLTPSPGAHLKSVANVVVTFSEDVTGVSDATFKVTPDPDGQWGNDDDGTPIGGTVGYDSGTATFTPSTQITTPGQYSVWLDDAITDTAGNPLAGGEFTASFTIDLTPPRVQNLVPEPGSTRPPNWPTVVVTFDEDVNRDTVTSDTFKVAHLGANRVWGGGDDTPVTGTLVTVGRTATLTATLTTEGHYGVRLEEGITDLAGNGLDGNGDGAEGGVYEATFIISTDLNGPRLTGLTPAPRGQVTTAPTVAATFNEDLDPTTVNANTFKVAGHSGTDGVWGTADDALVRGTVGYDVQTRTATFAPVFGSLVAPGEYAVWLDGTPEDGAAVKDVVGNALDGEYFPLLFPPSGTGLPGVHRDFLASFTIDTAGPRVTNLTIGASALGDNVENVPFVLAQFDEALNGATVTTSTFKLVDPDGADVLGTVTYTDMQGVGPFQAIFKPDAPVVAAGVYSVRLDGAVITDVAGNLLDGNGDYTLPIPVDGFPSGDGIPGGSFQASFNKVPDTTPPRVLALAPPPGSSFLNVLGLPALTVTFTEALNPLTVTPDALRLCTAPGDDRVWGTWDEGETFVSPVSVQYSETTFTAVFIFDPPSENHEYGVWVGSTITDLVGHTLDGEYPGAGALGLSLPSGNGVEGGDFVVGITLYGSETAPRVRTMWPFPGSEMGVIPYVDVQFDQLAEALGVPQDAMKVFSGPGDDGDWSATADNPAVAGSVIYYPDSHIATFQPLTPFVDGTYAVWVDDTVTDANGHLLDGEWTGDAPNLIRGFPSGDGVAGGEFLAFFTKIPDTVGPRVMGLGPVPGSTVDTTSELHRVVAQFAEPLNPATVTADTFKLFEFGRDGQRGTSDDVYLGGEVYYNADPETEDTFTVYFYTMGELTVPGQYGVWLDGETDQTPAAITDAAGNLLDGEYPGNGLLSFPSGNGTAGGNFEAGFTVADLTGPQVTSVWPLPGSYVGSATSVVVHLSENLDPATITADTFKVSKAAGDDGKYGTVGDTYVPGMVWYDELTATAYFLPLEPLAPGQYAVWMDGTTGIADLAGNPLDGEWPGTGPVWGLPSGDGNPGGDFVACFTVGPDTDTKGPRVVAMTPSPGTAVVPVDQVDVYFDEDLDPATVNSDTFKLLVGSGDDADWDTVEDSPVAAGLVSYNPVEHRATFALPGLLTRWLDYAVWLDGEDGIRDTAGNVLDGESDWRFPSFPTGNGTPGGSFLGPFWIGFEGGAPRVWRLTPSPYSWLETVYTVTAVFNQPLVEILINVNTFCVHSLGGDAIYGTDDDEVVPGTLSYDAEKWQVTFTPSQPITARGEYAVWMQGDNSPSMMCAVVPVPIDGTWPGSEPGFPSGNMERGGTFLATFSVGTTISIDDVTQPEGNTGESPHAFTVSLSAPMEREVQVDYIIYGASATAGSDYTGRSGRVTIPPNETSATIPVPFLGDTVVEPDETFYVYLGNAVNAGIADRVGEGKIINDDAGAASLSINDLTVAEGDTARFTVSLFPASLQEVTVGYATREGTATADDYTPVTGTLTFGAGETSKTVDVVTTPDTLIERNDTFYVDLSNALNATISDSQGQGWIYNDDSPVVSVTDALVNEGDIAPFTFTLSEQSPQTIKVEYATIMGTAREGIDYVPAGGILTFLPGDTSETVQVATLPDGFVEGSETFYLNETRLGNTRPPDWPGYWVGHGTIYDVPLPSLTIDDVTVTEGNQATFTVTLSEASNETVTVQYATEDGTALAPDDYDSVSTPLTLTFEPNVTTRQITVPTVQDLFDEPNEAFYVNLSLPLGARIGDGQGQALITDDDPPPTMSIGDPTAVVEGDSGTTFLAFTVSLSERSEQIVTVNYTTADTTATAGSDYTTTTGTLIFRYPDLSKEIMVPILGDTLVEGDETFTVTLSDAGNATLGDFQAVGTITDDDLPSVSIGDVTVTEGNVATFNVTLSQPHPSQQVTVQYATVDDTATAGSDYSTRTGTVTFDPTETTKPIAVPTLSDTLVEGPETFHVNLSSPTNATILDGQGVGTITDNDAPRWILRKGKEGLRQYVDADGDRFTLKYTGPGQAEVAFAGDPDQGADIAAITFTDAKSSTRLTSTLVQPSQAGQGRTTIGGIAALGQALGTLDFSLAQRGLPIPNRTSLDGTVEIGGKMTRLAVGGDVLGDVQIGGKLSRLFIGGTLDSQFLAQGTISTALVGALDVDARLTTNGSLSSLRTLGDLKGQVTAAQNIVKVTADGAIDAILNATLSLKSVFAGQHIAGVLGAGLDVGTVKAQGDVTAEVHAHRNISAVIAAGQLTSDLSAGGRIAKVQAAGIGGGPADLTRILAGDADHPNADIGTVKVGDGGLRNAEIKATRNVGAVTTTGGLEDTLVIAGLDPGPNGQYGKFGDLINRAADNVPNLKARFGSVKANAYAGDVRVMTGGLKLGSCTMAGQKLTTSTETPDAVLTLIHTKENVSTIV